MRKKIYIQNIEKIQSDMYFTYDEGISLHGLTPKGHMLVDSDEFAFVYILESSEEYIYVYFQEHFWPAIKKDLQSEAKFYIKNDCSIELESFREELTYLIENIKDNSNYGDSFVQKVESVFE